MPIYISLFNFNIVTEYRIVEWQENSRHDSKIIWRNMSKRWKYESFHITGFSVEKPDTFEKYVNSNENKLGTYKSFTHLM